MPQAASTTQDYLFLTALPNGRVDPGGDLRLSLFVTPSLGGSTLSDLFKYWPAAAQGLHWKVGFYSVAHVPIATSITPHIDSLSSGPDAAGSKLWAEIFADVTVTPRTATKHLRRTWRHSHNITKLSVRHNLLRLAHAYAHFFGRDNTDVASLLASTAPPELFLHPEYSTAGNPSNLAAKFSDRDLVTTRLTALVGTLTLPASFAKRVTYATEKLEDYGGAKLSAVSLGAVYISCLQSSRVPGGTNQSIVNAINAITSWFPAIPPPSVFQSMYPDINVVLDYIQMILFHRPNQAMPLPVQRPDFHQLLGMVQNYPAILRSLGLVYDFVVTPPVGLPPRFSVEFAIDSTDAANAPLSGITVHPVFTQCSVDDTTFSALARDANLINAGILNLQIPGASAGSRFSLVVENSDGQALALTDQSNNAARAIEYTSSAPTAMSPTSATPASGMVSTPVSTVDPSSGPPAPRTVGLALFDQDRLIKLEQAVSQVPEAQPGQPPMPPTDFYAEDLTLGYRVDVLYKGTFYSLCQRQSRYDIYQPRTDIKIDSWSPMTQMQLGADEGFISFGATQSVLDPNAPPDPTDANNSENTQTQIHQSVFTWSGWSLSVPQPNIPVMNPPQQSSDTHPEQSKHLAIRPCYQLPDKAKLPPLRFDTDYQVRCRVVDLAGNSAPSTIDPSNTQYPQYSLAPQTTFSRLEPIRAPHFLLLGPIDRVKEPGTHIDRMVIHDGLGKSARMLVPPRESLRLAELSGTLTSAELPSTAFAAQQLLRDGSFPSVACAKAQGWVNGSISDPGDNDAIFLANQGGVSVENPYYRDPRASYIRIEAADVSDDATQSRPIGVKWIKTGTGPNLPDCQPVCIRLKPASSNSASIKPADAATVDEYAGSLSVPALDVEVPLAGTVMLKISSAALDGSPANKASFPQYFTHLSRLHDLNMKNPSALGAPIAQQSTQTALASLQAQTTPVVTTNDFVDGTLEISTPSRTMTLVHAVKKPLRAPAFSFDKTGGLTVQRDQGASEAHVSGQLSAHWPSTSKITCYAEWTDCIDDVSRERPMDVHHYDVAFSLGGKDYVIDDPSNAERFRTLAAGLLQHFSDTRAHYVTYSLVASSNFREYYPLGDGVEEFQIKSEKSFSLTVLSSVRPKALQITYVIPAFLWADTYDHSSKTWYKGRRVVLRAYLERGFYSSGNNETVAVILADPKSSIPGSDQPFVSRWGGDPTRSVAAPVLQNELTEANLNEPGQTPVACVLAEGGTARAKPCKIQYSHDRRLWFTDIPIDTQHVDSPFVRLALARWQNDSLTVPSDLRCSQVTFADFMQVGDCRWASIQKVGHSTYKLTVSGAFPNESGPCPFTLTLYKRWFAMDRDMGWRKVECKSKCGFQFDGVDSSSVGSWSVTFQTPDSVYLTKYRALIEEAVSSGQLSPKLLSMFVNLP